MKLLHYFDTMHHIKDGVFTPEPMQDKAMLATLDSLAKWSRALAQLRSS